MMRKYITVYRMVESEEDSKVLETANTILSGLRNSS